MTQANYSAGAWAGHGVQTDGSFDPGCAYKKDGIVYTEAALVLPIAKWAARYLRACNVKVSTDAFSNNDINMIVQVERSNKEKVDVHISIHLDYYLAPSGCIPLYKSAKGKKLATEIEKHLLKIDSMESRGVFKRNDLYELNATDMPAVIVEVGSIKANLSLIKGHPRVIGRAIAHGICDYLGVEWEYTYYRTSVSTKGRYTHSINSKVRKTVPAKKKIAIWKLSPQRKWGYSPIYGWIHLCDLERV